MADFVKGSDTMRAEAAQELVKELEVLLAIYMDSGARVPDFTTARKAPVGDRMYLLLRKDVTSARPGGERSIEDWVENEATAEELHAIAILAFVRRDGGVGANEAKNIAYSACYFAAKGNDVQRAGALSVIESSVAVLAASPDLQHRFDELRDTVKRSA